MDMRSYKGKNYWIEYTPDFELGDVSNRSLPKEERITVEIHPLSYGEQKSYAARVKMIGKAGKKGFKFNTSEIDKSMFIENVRTVTNLSIDGDLVTTPDQLYEDGHPDLVSNIVDALQDISVLEEGDSKNFSA